VSKLRQSWIVLMVAVGLLSLAGVAVADDSVSGEEAPAGDTLINYGYDAENHVFIIHTSSADSTYDCSVPTEVLVGYGSLEDGSFEVTLFEEEGVPVEFPERTTEESAGEPAGDAESVLDEMCQFSASVISGPNGQINHGQFMKLFKQIVGKETSRCFNRIIAQSDLGKGDQQVRTPDVEEAGEAFDMGEADFETFIATCDPGKKHKGDDHPSNKNKGKANKGKADRPRGNSDDAPGRNK
jgi:hypothetical protein